MMMSAWPAPPYHHHQLLPRNTLPAGLELFSLILLIYFQVSQKIMILPSKLDLGRLQSVNNIGERR